MGPGSIFLELVGLNVLRQEVVEVASKVLYLEWDWVEKTCSSQYAEGPE